MFNLSAICLSHKHSISRRIQKDWFGLDLYKLPFCSPSKNSLLTGLIIGFSRFPRQLPILRKSIGHLLADLVVGANHANFPIIYLSVSHWMRGVPPRIWLNGYQRHSCAVAIYVVPTTRLLRNGAIRLWRSVFFPRFCFFSTSFLLVCVPVDLPVWPHFFSQSTFLSYFCT